MGKGLSQKYGQKFLDSTKKSTTDTLKAGSQRVIQKMPEATGDLVGNKIAEKTTKAASKSAYNISSKSMKLVQLDEI